MRQRNPKNKSQASMKTNLTLEGDEESNNQSFHSSKSDLLKVSESIDLANNGLNYPHNRSFQFFEDDSEDIISEHTISPYHFDPLHEPELEDLDAEHIGCKTIDLPANLHAISNIEITLEGSYSWKSRSAGSDSKEEKNASLVDFLGPSTRDADPFFLELEPIIDLNHDCKQDLSDNKSSKEQASTTCIQNEPSELLSLDAAGLSENMISGILDSFSERSRKNSLENIYTDFANYSLQGKVKWKVCKEGFESIRKFLWADFQPTQKPEFGCNDPLCRQVLSLIHEKRLKARPLRNEQFIKKILNHCIKSLLKQFRQDHFGNSRISSGAIKQHFMKIFTGKSESFDQLCRPHFRKTIRPGGDMLSYSQEFFKRMSALAAYRKMLLKAVGALEASLELFFLKELRQFWKTFHSWLDKSSDGDLQRSAWLYFHGKGVSKVDKLVKLPWSQAQYTAACSIVKAKFLQYS